MFDLVLTYFDLLKSVHGGIPNPKNVQKPPLYHPPSVPPGIIIVIITLIILILIIIIIIMIIVIDGLSLPRSSYWQRKKPHRKNS